MILFFFHIGNDCLSPRGVNDVNNFIYSVCATQCVNCEMRGIIELTVNCVNHLINQQTNAFMSVSVQLCVLKSSTSINLKEESTSDFEMNSILRL